MTNKIKDDATLCSVEKELATASSNQYLDLLASVLSGTVTEPTEDHRKAILSKFLINSKSEVKPFDYLFTYKNVGMFPKGNLIAIKAKAKSGKSTFCSIVCAGILGDTEFGYVSRHQDAKIAYLDTEMSEANTQRINSIVNTLIGNRGNDDERFQALNILQNTLQERVNIVECLAKSRYYDLIVIDGLADLIEKINDPDENRLFLNEILKIAQDNNVCIAFILHISKSSKEANEMFGSAGTAGINKCYACYMVERTATDYRVTETDSRNTPADEMRFVFDENGIPRNADSLQQQIKEIEEYKKQQEKVTSLRLEFKSLYKYEEEENGLSYSDLKDRFIKKEYGKKPTFDRHLKDACSYGILLSEGDGLYKFDNTLE